MRTARLSAWRWLAALALPLAAAAPAADPLTLAEYDIKAGFIYNFVKLVKWPDAAPQLVLCVIGMNPFGTASAIDGKPVGGRTLMLRSVPAGAPPADCGIVFVPAPEAARAPALLAALRERPVLTIGESENFAHRGGVINFYREEDKVRFEINVDAARRARLQISSRLLKLARIVRDGEGTP